MDAASTSSSAGRAFWTEPASPATAKIYSPPQSAANTPGLGHSESFHGYFNHDAAAAPAPASGTAERARLESRLGKNHSESFSKRWSSTVQRAKNTLQNRDNQRFAACLWSCGCAGWSDAALGALIPYMETYFSVRSLHNLR